MKNKIFGTALAVLLLAFIIVPVGCKKKTEPEKTFYDVAAEDDARLRAEPQPKETQPTETAGAQEQLQKAQQPTKQFRELTEAEDAEAQRLLEWAIQSRKMGRLPAISYKQTIDACRQIIKQFPDTEYEFKAKRILADIPEQYRSRYNITEDEIDLGNYK
jgi:hypothetical protein